MPPQPPTVSPSSPSFPSETFFLPFQSLPNKSKQENIQKLQRITDSRQENRRTNISNNLYPLIKTCVSYNRGPL